jgi:hypothetical protein
MWRLDWLAEKLRIPGPCGGHKRRLRLIATLVLLSAATVVLADVGINSGASVAANKMFVNANGSAYTTSGKADVASYVVSVTTAYTAVESLINLEAESGRGFRITKVCIHPGSATAAANILWQLIRTTTASSAGTVIAAESTTTNSVTKMDPGDSNWSGAARTGGTEGTSGAVLDQGNVYANIAATGSSETGLGGECKEYGLVDGKQPIVAAGTTNGVKLMLTATAGGVGQAASIHFVAN